MNGFEQLHEYILSWTDAGQWQKSEEIVRCRDCACYAVDGLGGYCTQMDFQIADGMEDGFCAWGERGRTK